MTQTAKQELRISYHEKGFAFDGWNEPGWYWEHFDDGNVFPVGPFDSYDEAVAHFCAKVADPNIATS